LIDAMAASPPKPRFSAERRRALKLLASSGGGVNAALLVHIHGFKRHVLAGLVRRKLAAAEREVAMAGGKAVEVVRIRITAAGRRAIGSE
jgi:hypothetical protein